MTSNQKIYLGQKFYYARDYGAISEFIVCQIKQVKQYGEETIVLFEDDDFEPQGNIIFIDKKDKKQKLNFGFYRQSYYHLIHNIIPKKDYLVCKVSPKKLTKLLASREIEKQKEIIKNYYEKNKADQEKIKECLEIISKCSSVSWLLEIKVESGETTRGSQ